MKKGFTLIELLAVLIIIGTIGVIAFITVDGVVKSSKNTLYEAQVQVIYDGTDAWVTDNLDTVKGSDYYCITLSILQENGYVEKNLINPKDDTKFDGNLKIKITDTISGFDYSIEETVGC